MQRDEGVLDDLLSIPAVTEQEHRETDERRTVSAEKDVQNCLTVVRRWRTGPAHDEGGLLVHHDLPSSIVPF